MTYVYQPYPRRLYMSGEVIDGDLHATNSVIVQSEIEEAAARANGYRKAYEPAPESDSSGGSGDSSPSSQLPGDQGADTAGASADPIEVSGLTPANLTPEQELEFLRLQANDMGLKVHHRAGTEKIRAAIAEAKA